MIQESFGPTAEPTVNPSPLTLFTCLYRLPNRRTSGIAAFDMAIVRAL